MGLVEPFASLISQVYKWALAWDQKTRKRTRLPVPVISVGNIAMGGRAKTPMVIELCRQLKQRAYVPVVLTRGYGRLYKNPVWILCDVHNSISFYDARSKSALQDTQNIFDKTGDEALEIALQARVNVLVSPQRTHQALEFLKTHSNVQKNLVFILDDGFQHWSLERDLDLVLLHPNDLTDSLFPKGFLRETPEALQRADFVFSLGEDCFKVSVLPKEWESELLAVQEWALLAGRAPDSTYAKQLSELMQKSPAKQIYLKDHADHDKLNAAWKQIDSKTPVLIGHKEAVKLFPLEALLNSETRLQKPETSSLYIVPLRLETKDPDVWNQIHTRLESLK